MFHVKEDAPEGLTRFSQNNPMQSSARLEIIVFHVKQRGTPVGPVSRETAKKWNKR
jgi:hypothetical protein